MKNQITIIKYKANDDLKLSMAPCCLYKVKFFIWSRRISQSNLHTLSNPRLTATYHCNHAVEALTIPTSKFCYTSMPLFVLCSFLVRGFLDGSVVKNQPANAGDADSIPGSGRSPGEGNGNPVHHSCLGNPIDRRSLAGQNLWGYKRLRHNLATKQQQQLLISPTFEPSLSTWQLSP